jgi:phosphatidylglycerophosphate synthase
MVNKLADHHECPLDKYLFRFIDNHLHIYHKLGITPNMVTTIGFIFGLFAAYQVLQGHILLAIVLWILSYYFDCVDGKLARKYNQITKFGDYYDHVCDFIKYSALLLALIYSNRKKTSSKQWSYLGIILVLLLLSFIHMGYQETIYNKKHESGWLNMCTLISSYDPHPEKTIQYTKYFGCGNIIIGFALLIIFWRK